jgi:hypothetical protein
MVLQLARFFRCGCFTYEWLRCRRCTIVIVCGRDGNRRWHTCPLDLRETSVHVVSLPIYNLHTPAHRSCEQKTGFWDIYIDVLVIYGSFRHDPRYLLVPLASSTALSPPWGQISEWRGTLGNVLAIAFSSLRLLSDAYGWTWIWGWIWNGQLVEERK